MGRDTAVYGGDTPNYTVNRNQHHRPNCQPRWCRHLANIERLRFADGTLALDIALPAQGESNARSAFRLYEAAFNPRAGSAGPRLLDQGHDGGTSALQAAQGFVASQEFRRRLRRGPRPPSSSSPFLHHILGRAPEPPATIFWFNILNGAPTSAPSCSKASPIRPRTRTVLNGIIGHGHLAAG